MVCAHHRFSFLAHHISNPIFKHTIMVVQDAVSQYISCYEFIETLHILEMGSTDLKIRRATQAMHLTGHLNVSMQPIFAIITHSRSMPE